MPKIKDVKSLAGIAKDLYEDNYIEKLRQSEDYIEQMEEAVNILANIKEDNEFIERLRNTIKRLKELKEINT